MKLYGYWRSSSSWRVRIALNYKAIGHQVQAVKLLGGTQAAEQYQPAYRAINPMSQVPVLELDETGPAGPRRITQSMAILEYLEERFPLPPLLPGDAWLRGRARQMAEMVNAGIQPYQNSPGVLGYVKEKLGGDEVAWARHFIQRGLDALEAVAQETAGSFLVGEDPTFADLCLVPQLYSARRFGADPTGWPTLLRAEASCAALPAFQAAHPDSQPDKPGG